MKIKKIYTIVLLLPLVFVVSCNKKENSFNNSHNKLKNQELFHEKHTTIIDKDKSYKFVFPDKMKKQISYEFKIFFQINESSAQENLLGKEYYYLIFSPHYNDDFSNIESIKPDTIIP